MRLLAVFLGLVLGLSMIAAGSRAGVGLTVEGVALRDCVGGPGAWNHDEPGGPPPRLLDAELPEDSEDDSDDHRSACARTDHQAFALDGLARGRMVFFEPSWAAAQRVREGHGARGPPIA